jgi:NAD(P)-dependent dehydrogenase (short-subunit alcohol dehydrogenase family)
MASDKKVALITGANKGIGLEIARQLGQQGITVVVGSRDPHKGQEAVDTLKGEGIDAHTLKLEVTNAADRDAALAFFQQLGRLDILVNNAGIMLEQSDGVTPDTLARTYDANVIAPYFLTETLLPLLKAAPAGRVVHQSSILGSLTTVASGQIPVDFMLPAYNSSKSALNMLGVIQAEALKGTNVKVNIAHPGSVKTDMNPGGDLSLEEGAKTAVTLATLPDDGPTGGFFHLGETLPW